MQQTDNENSQTNQKRIYLGPTSNSCNEFTRIFVAAGEENKQLDLGSERANHSI